MCLLDSCQPVQFKLHTAPLNYSLPHYLAKPGPTRQQTQLVNSVKPGVAEAFYGCSVSTVTIPLGWANYLSHEHSGGMTGATEGLEAAYKQMCKILQELNDSMHTAGLKGLPVTPPNSQG